MDIHISAGTPTDSWQNYNIKDFRIQFEKVVQLQIIWTALIIKLFIVFLCLSFLPSQRNIFLMAFQPKAC